MHEDSDNIVLPYARDLFCAGHRREMDEYRRAAIAYLRRVRDDGALSLNEIAQRVGVSHTTLTRPVNSQNYKYVPKFATLQKIATVTNIPLPPELTNPDLHASVVVPLRKLSVRGVVAAGMWQAVEAVQDVALGEAPMVEDTRYSGVSQWAELLRGPSMNRTYLDGDFLHVVDALELGYFPQVGDDVIVERHSDQGGTIERTCKRIAMIDGVRALVGDSTVDSWNQPLQLEGGDGTVVQIVGLVIGSYRPRRR